MEKKTDNGLKARAVFLDRDGTINQDRGYVYRIADFHFYPRAVDAICSLNRAGWKVIVVTNQAGIAHGYFSEEDVRELHRFLHQEVAAGGGRLDGIYYCPHHPGGKVSKYAVSCGCRKPAPGMLLQAAAEHGLDLAKCWMVGDKFDVDIGLARNAGTRGALVRTGYGEGADALMQQSVFQPDLVAENLWEAVKAILAAG